MNVCVCACIYIYIYIYIYIHIYICIYIHALKHICIPAELMFWAILAKVGKCLSVPILFSSESVGTGSFCNISVLGYQPC